MSSMRWVVSVVLFAGIALFAIQFTTAQDGKNAAKSEADKTKKPAAAPKAKPPVKPKVDDAPKAPAAPKPEAAPSTEKPSTEKPSTEKPPRAKSSPAVAALAERVRAAKTKFANPDTGRLTATRNAAAATVAALDARFTAMSQPNGANWKKYLRLDAVQSELQKSQNVDVALLRQTVERLTAGYDGLEKEPYRNATTALAAYADAVEAAQSKELKNEYAKQLDALADAVEAGGDDVTDAAHAVAISDSVDWLRRYGLADAVVADLTQRYSQPNLLVDVDESFVVDTVGGEVDEHEPVVDCILGTSIRGRGHTVGRLQLDFVESSERGVINALFRGTNYSKTVGYNRSAVIHSTGRTELEGLKTLVVTEDGIQAVQGTSHARVYNKINGIGSTKGGIIGKIVIRVASKKAPQQQGQAQAIAARHAERRLLVKLNDQSAELVEQANSNYARRIRTPLIRFNAEPQYINIATTDDSLLVRVLQNAGGRMAAPGAAPKPASTGAGLRLHHSLIDNTTEQMLAGRRFDRARLQDLVQNQLGFEMPESDDDTPFAITFADADPLTVVLDDNKISVTVRGKQFMSDDKLYDGMNITASYAAATTADGARLTRDGDLIIYPPGFRSGVDRLTLSQTALRRLLQRRFEKLLPAEIEGEGLELEADRGRLVVSQLKLDGGWAVVGFKRLPGLVGAE